VRCGAARVPFGSSPDRIIAGSDHLGLADMIGFAAIHTVFFLLLALLYAGLRRGALEAAA
jgi:hypothetical protein